MNLPTLLTKVAALQGHPIPVSSTSADFDDHGSEVIEADPSHQLRRVKGVRLLRNLDYARRTRPDGGDLRLRLDVMVPVEGGPHPLVVFVPGGGFVRAPKAGGARMRRAAAAAGFAVASIEYRTVLQGATYVDALDDIASAVLFLAEHADEYGIDPRRVGLWGESAGGYLVAMTGVTGHDARWGESGSPVHAIVDKFGASDLSRIAEGFDDDTKGKTLGPGNALATFAIGPRASTLDDDPAAVRTADPSRRTADATAAFLLFHGSDDRIVSPIQTSILHDALRDAGVRSRRVLVKGAGHGDIAVTSGEEKYWTTEPMLGIIVDFLAAELRSPAATSGGRVE